ncbi:hypothetical protein ACFQ1M_09200 [Sungkyunkwania multivorans]|uniref:Anti-sigma factor n=1 Tax=Sungkyunkwania multivorans TaxID=1173618 RepID=A0ABW3CZ70_9FLAO
MELVNIEKLLEKYFEAATTAAEEQKLRQYFVNGDVAPHLAQYAPMFQYFSAAKQERYTKTVPLTPKRKSKYLKWISVAAVAVLMVGTYFGIGGPLDPEPTPEELAQAKMVLAMFSENFNKATDQATQQVSYLNALNEGTASISQLEKFNQGTQHINHIDEFKETTNKFLYNKQ